jgi:hypothetical protein
VDPQALFVYGSLQFPDVLFTLIDRVPDHSPAAAHGWRITALPGRVYPGLVPGQGTASGYLISGLVPHPIDLAAQHRVLMAKNEQLRVLGHIAANQHRHRSENQPDGHVSQRERHFARVSTMAAAGRRISRSKAPAEFSSGTAS